MDNLSTNPCLREILSYLSASDIHHCLAVNKSVNQEIHRSRRHFKKTLVHLTLSSKSTRRNRRLNKTNVQGDAIGISLTFPTNTWPRVNRLHIYISKRTALFGGKDARSFLMSFDRYHGHPISKTVLKRKPQKSERFELQVVDFLEFVQDILMCLFERIGFKRFALVETEGDDEESKRYNFTVDLLGCIRDCLQMSRGMREQPRLSMSGSTDEHFEICRILDSRDGWWWVPGSVISGPELVKLPPKWSHLSIITPHEAFTSLEGLRMFLQEWVDGKRSIKNIELVGEDKWEFLFTKMEVERMLSTFVDCKLVRYSAATLGRRIDMKRLDIFYAVESWSWTFYEYEDDGMEETASDR